MEIDGALRLTLDAIAADPSVVQGLPRATLEELALRAVAVHAAIATALVAGGSTTLDPANARADDERLLTALEVARVLAVPVANVYELARRNAIPKITIGRYVRVPAKALREWIAERRVDNRAPRVRQFPKGRG